MLDWSGICNHFIILGRVDMSIKTRLILIFIIVILLTSASISLFSYKAAENTVETQSAEWVGAYINQTVNRFNFFMDSIVRASMAISFNKDLNATLQRIGAGSYDDYNNLLRVMDLVAVFNNTNQYVYQVNIYGFKNNIFLTSRGSNMRIDGDSAEYMLVKELFIDNERAKTISQKWIECRPVKFYNQEVMVFTLIMPINDRLSNDIIGCVVTYITDKQISSLFRDWRLSSNHGSVALINENGAVISAPDDGLLGMDLSGYMGVDNQGQASFNKNVDGQECLVTYAATQYAGWGFLSIVPIKELMRENTSVLRQTILIVTGVTLILAILISYIFNLGFYKPVKDLVDNINLHGSYKDAGRSLMSRTDEIGFIFRSFDEVFSEKEELLKNVYEQKLHLKDAEIQLLHSQINPHFLYNTLDNVVWMNKSQKYDEANKLIRAIVRFFRASLGSGDEIVTVGKEKLQMESYFEIQTIRYADRLKVIIDFDDNILDCGMLSLLLQPIVENSIYHGIEKKIGDGVIKISGARDGCVLVFVIEDDGVGASDERLAEVNRAINAGAPEAAGFSALHNINKRIKLFYGDEYGIMLSGRGGGGMKVVVRIPVIEAAGAASVAGMTARMATGAAGAAAAGAIVVEEGRR